MIKLKMVTDLVELFRHLEGDDLQFEEFWASDA